MGEEGVDATEEKEDDFLLPKLDSQDQSTAAPVVAPKRKRALKIKRDGTAQGAAGKHVYFAGDGSETTSLLAQMAEESNDQVVSKKESREAFLERVARDLAQRDTSDAAADRARIHERHQKMRRLMKEGQDGDSEEDTGVVLGGSSASSGACSEAEPEECSVSEREENVKKPTVTSVSKRGMGNKRRTATSNTAKISQPAPVRVEETDFTAPGADLSALERAALSKLNSGGLFG